MDDNKSYKMCGKKQRYDTDFQAAIVAGKQQYKHPGTLLRWYRCYICDKWHLTHTKK